MGDDGSSSAELGITAKDMGIQQESEVDNTTLANAHSRILIFDTPEYFAGYEEIKGKEPPVIFSFATSDRKQTIDLVGTQHAHQLPTQEQKDAMIGRLDGMLREYLVKTASDPSKRLIMIEGGGISGVVGIQDRIDKLTQMMKTSFQEQGVVTEKDAVEKYGEMGAAIDFALLHNISIMSPEPSNEEIIARQKEAGIPDIDLAVKHAILYLDTYVHRGQLREQKRFTTEEVFTAFKNACEQTGWQKELLLQTKEKLTGNSEDDQQVMRAFVDQSLPLLNVRMQESNVGFNLVNPDYSWAFDPSNKDVYNHLHSPSSKVEVFNKMSNISGEYRDDYILDRVVEAVSEGKSPFIVYGDGHVVKLKPALDSLYSQINNESTK